MVSLNNPQDSGGDGPLPTELDKLVREAVRRIGSLQPNGDVLFRSHLFDTPVSSEPQQRLLTNKEKFLQKKKAFYENLPHNLSRTFTAKPCTQIKLAACTAALNSYYKIVGRLGGDSYYGSLPHGIPNIDDFELRSCFSEMKLFGDFAGFLDALGYYVELLKEALTVTGGAKDTFELNGVKYFCPNPQLATIHPRLVELSLGLTPTDLFQGGHGRVADMLLADTAEDTAFVMAVNLRRKLDELHECSALAFDGNDTALVQAHVVTRFGKDQRMDGVVNGILKGDSNCTMSKYWGLCEALNWSLDELMDSNTAN